VTRPGAATLAVAGVLLAVGVTAAVTVVAGHRRAPFTRNPAGGR
jgi:hypothetical protein